MTHPTPRGTAVDILNKVFGSGRLLSELEHDYADLAPADRARAFRLANQTLRGLERADRLLSRHLKRKPPLGVMNILRLGTVELCLGGDAHGVVSELVTLAASDRRSVKLKGLVNAVLRAIAEKDYKSWSDLRPPQLPVWLRSPLVKAWGKGAVTAMEQAHFRGAALDLTVPGNASEWTEKLGGILLPTGSVRVTDAGQVSAMPGFDEGAWWVQDAAAAVAARALAVEPGEKVLDLCAAPGGKTLQLAAAGADVTALDISAPRMARVEENLARTNLKATCVVADAFEIRDASYNAILLDAPCSATGTIRRHPDLPYAKKDRQLDPVLDVQERLLDHALSLMAPKGRLIYCTCSLLPDEGEKQIAAFLERHPGIAVDRDAFDLPGIDPAWKTSEGGLRLRPDYWPELGGMDGFYMACLRGG
ncbi:MAG: transcription antitermination factor NusB [Pseudomonadota bacterium]